MRVLAVAAALPMVAAVVTIGGGKTPNADASENAETWLSRTVLFVSNLHATDSLAGDKLRLFTAMSVYVMQLHFIHAYGVNGTIDCGRFRERVPTRVYACAAYAFAKVKTERPQANGFIFMHSDFFVSQPFFSGVSKLDVDQLWHAGWATPKLPSETKYVHWSQNLHKVRTALQTFSAIGLRVPHTACGDWSDLYFIPAKASPLWVSVMTRMSDVGIQNEIAICTGRQIIELNLNMSRSHRLPGCPKSYSSSAGRHICVAGSALTQLHLRDIVLYPAGHKVNLANETILRLLQQRLRRTEAMRRNQTTPRLSLDRGRLRWRPPSS